MNPTLLIPVAIAALVLTACGGTETPPRSVEEAPSASVVPDRQYEIAVEARFEDDTLEVSGSTNLPPGTIVTISVSRAFLNPDSDADNPRAANAAEPGNVEVGDGSFTSKLTVDEEDLLVGLDLPGEQIDRIADALTVCATIQTGKDFDGTDRQPRASVRELLGPNGEHLADHPAARVFGKLTDTPSHWLEVSTHVDVPPPVRKIRQRQGSSPEITTIDGFCL